MKNMCRQKVNNNRGDERVDCARSGIFVTEFFFLPGRLCEVSSILWRERENCCVTHWNIIGEGYEEFRIEKGKEWKCVSSVSREREYFQSFIFFARIFASSATGQHQAGQ
uniref:Uncharacterized protein n=1 Tax=Cacopsylla melanoneura TaxID=428564 RepID=A0A8D8TM67_9HEMI